MSYWWYNRTQSLGNRHVSAAARVPRSGFSHADVRKAQADLEDLRQEIEALEYKKGFWGQNAWPLVFAAVGALISAGAATALFVDPTAFGELSVAAVPFAAAALLCLALPFHYLRRHRLMRAAADADPR